ERAHVLPRLRGGVTALSRDPWAFLDVLLRPSLTESARSGRKQRFHTSLLRRHHDCTTTVSPPWPFRFPHLSPHLPARASDAVRAPVGLDLRHGCGGGKLFSGDGRSRRHLSAAAWSCEKPSGALG